MAEITTQTEMNLINNVLASENNYWIGLADLAREGIFIWQHSFTIATYTNWLSGEPNEQNGSEDCTFMIATRTHEWADIDCYYNPAEGKLMHALCEADN